MVGFAFNVCGHGMSPVGDKPSKMSNDIPETDEEKAWLDKQNFKNTADDAYTG